MNLKAFAKILIAASLIFQTGPVMAEAVAETQDKCTKCSETDIKTCKSKAAEASAGSKALSGDVDDGKKSSTGTLDLGNLSEAECMKANSLLAEAAPACECAVKKCKDDKAPELVKTKTKKSELEDILTQAKAAAEGSASCGAAGKQIAENTKDGGDDKGKGKGGGMDPMMAGLIGAGIGAGLMYLMNKKNEKEAEELGDGNLDCSHVEGPNYADCDEYFSAACTGTPVVTPATSTSAAAPAAAPTPEACSKFTDRYCNLNGKGVTADTPTTIEAGGTSMGVTLGGNGKGIATPYCKLTVAKAFCDKQTAEAKPSCPSCIMLANASTPACSANPLVCLPQHSLADIAVAKVTCMGDPAFSDPVYAAGGGAAVPTELSAGGLPTVVLPTGTAPVGGSDNLTATDPNAPAVTLPNSIGGGYGTSSAQAGAAAAVAGGLNREGLSNANGSSTTGGGGIGGAAGSGGFGDRVAGGGAAGMRPTSAGRSPASDVGVEFGSNLFKISAEAIANSCAASALNCHSNNASR